MKQEFERVPPSPIFLIPKQKSLAFAVKLSRQPRQAFGGRLSQPMLAIENVVGNTVKSSNFVAQHPKLPLLAYAAGATVVVVNCINGLQRAHLVASSSPAERLPDCLAGVQFQPAKQSNRPVSSIAWSYDGNFVAVGESGPSPQILIYNYKHKSIVASLKGHQSTVKQVEFVGSSFLLSLGTSILFQLCDFTSGDTKDGSFYIWNWKTGQKKSLSTFTVEMNGFCLYNNASLYLVGKKSTLWRVEPSSANLVDTLSESSGRAVSLGETVGIVSSSSGGFYACAERNSQKVFKKLASEKGSLRLNVSEEGATVSFCSDLIAVSSSAGTIQLFDLKSGQCVANIVPPNSSGANVLLGSADQPSKSSCRAMRILEGKRKLLAAFYSDKTIIVWDIKNLKQIILLHEFKAHCGRVLGLELPFESVQSSDFYTCSDDGTVCKWSSEYNAEDDTLGCPQITARFVIDQEAFMKPSSVSVSPISPQHDLGVRTIKLSQDGSVLFAFDRSGALHVVSTVLGKVLLRKEIHDSEVLAMDILTSTGTTGERRHLVASSGRDCLVHVYEISGPAELVTCNHVQTINDHSSSVTGIKFVYKDLESKTPSQSLQLITCSLDKSIVFRGLDLQQKSISFGAPHCLTVPSSFIDLDLDCTHRYTVGVTKDEKIFAFHVLTGSKERVYQYDGGSVKLLGKSGSLLEFSKKNNTVKASFDPSGTFVAFGVSGGETGATGDDRERSVHLVNFFSGKSITEPLSTEIASFGGGGHGSLITSVKFRNDCSRIYSSDADGCVICWKINDVDSVADMRQRLDVLLRRGILGSNIVAPIMAPVDIGNSVPAPSAAPVPNVETTPVKRVLGFTGPSLPGWAKSKLTGEPTQPQPLKPASNVAGKWAEKAPITTELFRSQDWLESGGHLLSPPSVQLGATQAIRDKWRTYTFARDETIQAQAADDDQEAEIDDLPLELLQADLDLQPPVTVSDQQNEYDIARALQEEFSLASNEDIKFDSNDADLPNVSAILSAESDPVPSLEEDNIEPVKVGDISFRGSCPRESLSMAALTRTQSKQESKPVYAQSYLDFLRQERAVRLDMIQRDQEAMLERLKQLGYEVNLEQATIVREQTPTKEASPNFSARAMRRVLSAGKLDDMAATDTDEQSVVKTVQKSQATIANLMSLHAATSDEKQKFLIQDCLKDIHQKLTLFIAGMSPDKVTRPYAH